jgi:hypothetical protein
VAKRQRVVVDVEWDDGSRKEEFRGGKKGRRRMGLGFQLDAEPKLNMSKLKVHTFEHNPL